MNKLTSSMFMSSILLVSAVADMGVVSAAEKEGFAVYTATSVKSKSKTKVLSERRAGSKSDIKTRMRKQARLAGNSNSRLSNTIINAVRMGAVSPSGKELVPVDKLQEVSLTRLRDPAGLPGEGDYRPPMEEDITAPLPEGVDPEKLSPGRGDPRDIPEGMTEEDYLERNRSSDYRARDMTTREGQLTMIKFGDENGEFPGQHAGKPEPASSDSSGGADTDEDGIKLGEGDSAWEDEDEIDADVATYERQKDPEPEGDDPDEIRGASAQDGRRSDVGEMPTAPVVPSGSSGSKRRPGEWLPGETVGEHGRRVTSGTPLPEDGGPDESVSAGSIEALNTSRLHLGETTKPTPDAGQGGGPIDPGQNAVQGQVHIANIGAALSPTPEVGGDGGTTPPRPEF